MNRKLPYEDAFLQQMNRLQLPDEDDSWQKMNMLLNEEAKRKPVLFFKLVKLKGWVVLLVLLLCGMEIRMPFFNKVNKEYTSKKVHTILSQQIKPIIDASVITGAVSPPLQHSFTSTSAKNYPGERPSVREHVIASDQQKSKSETLVHLQGSRVHSAVYIKSYKHNSAVHTGISSNNRRGIKKAGLVNPENTVKGIQTGAAEFVHKLPDPQNNHLSIDTTAILHDGELKQVSVQLHFDPAIQALLEKNEVPVKITYRAGKKYFISAGIGLQQQLPVGGQKQVAYGYNGDKSIISDYIPSLYFRFEKDHTWFIQGEFSYAAPQLIKDFSYSRQTLTDSLSGNATVTSIHLKKTFNNQVPLSFNYYINPNWSLGAGGLFSWFHGAITEKETVQKGILPQAGAVTNQIIPIEKYTDSFLYRSHTYVLLQTNYQWRNFSAGLRFKKDIQPYIKYTLPDGSITDRRNWSLEFMVRLALWKSAKF